MIAYTVHLYIGYHGIYHGRPTGIYMIKKQTNTQAWFFFKSIQTMYKAFSHGYTTVNSHLYDILVQNSANMV